MPEENGRPLRLLLIEDREDDEILVLRELKRGGYDVRHLRVQTPVAMRQALDQGEWDLVICDYAMPQFNAKMALQTLKESGRDIPFILVSGTVGDERALRELKAGAHDFIPKTNLVRLLPAIEREVGDARERAARRLAEAELRESTHTFGALFTASPLPIMSVDRDGIVNRWNPAAEQVFGWSAEEVLGCRPPFLGSDQQRDDFNAILRRVLNGESFFQEVTRTNRRGSQLTLQVSTAPLKAANGDVLGMMCVFTDVTEARRLEEQFRQAQKMEAVGRLAGGMAHDFNNVLTVISGYASLLYEEVKEAPWKADVQEILNAAERAAGFTRQLLAFSRKQVVVPEKLDLDEVVRGLCNMLRRLIGEHIDLRLELNNGTQRVLADRGQVEQVIMNLVINANDAIGRSGTIFLRSRSQVLDGQQADLELPPGKYIALEVEDTGSGMPPEVIEHIFEPFFTTKDPGKGTGLGLSTTYSLVEQMGGSIRVRSTIGQGTIFSVFLPVADGGETKGDSAALEAPPARAQHERILVVEDDASIRRLIQRTLDEAGYDPLIVGHSADALMALADHASIRLLLTDVALPDMSGQELIARALAQRPDLPVVYMSGYAEEELELPEGSAFLAKPFTATELLDAVRKRLQA